MMERPELEQVLERLEHWAKLQPDKKAWTFLNDKGDPVNDYAYSELHNAAGALAEYLTETVKLRKGDRVLLVFFPCLDFTISLLACFRAGLIAVPVFPPDPRKLKKDLHHFVNIQENSDARVALTNAQYNFVKKVEDIKLLFSSVKWPELRWVPVDDQLKRGRTKPAGPAPRLEGNDVAFLQYTSGSTSEPKGVMISHNNLAHNLTLITRELKADQNTVNVSWLPQFHDMGLIGSYLGIIYCGGHGYYLSPVSFIRDPVVWMRTISRFSGTHTQSPSFGYALTARKFRESMEFSPTTPVSLDLSSLRHMINAAEPVNYKEMIDFYDTFQPYQLPNNVVVPTYGLAEHTVFVCSGGKLMLTVNKRELAIHNRVEILEEEELVYNPILHSMTPITAHDPSASGPSNNSHSTIRMIGCGYCSRSEGLTAVIVSFDDNDPENEVFSVAQDLEVGEIWLDSPSKARGYWELPEISQRDFCAKLPDERYKDMQFLRTGDKGFFYKGELFICGRIKDMIIIRGANHYPQDLERTVEQGLSESLRAGCSAAVVITANQLIENSGSVKGSKLLHTLSTRHEEEYTIFLAEVKDGVDPAEYSRIAQRCVQLVSLEHSVTLRCVYLLSPRTIPKTTSGKIARSWCRRALLQNSLNMLFEYDNTQFLSSEAMAMASEEEQPATTAAASGGERTEPGYTQVPLQEPPPRRPGIESLPLETIRGMEHPQLVYRLQSALQLILRSAGGGNAEHVVPIDEHVPLVSLGVDSMSIVQFKGVLENRFYCELPDEFIFSQHCNLHQLALAVHAGGITAEQVRLIATADGQVDGTQAPGKPRATAEAVGDLPRQPLCPWFTCCY